MEYLHHSKNITAVHQNSTHQQDAHQILYYNVGNTVAFVDGVPVLPFGGTLSEKDYSIIVWYNQAVVITFGNNTDEEPDNHLMIIEKKYYKL